MGIFEKNGTALPARASGYREKRDAVLAKNRFAFCFMLMGEKTLAAELTQQLGERYTDYPWYYLGDPARVFVLARKGLYTAA